LDSWSTPDSSFFFRQSLRNLPNYPSWTISPTNYKTRFYTPKLFKTGQITPQVILNGGFATMMVVLSFSFLFIFAEFLKNHSKSKENHKIENSILLDST
jgi:hypothetical protein